jgi:hypothetical protein
MTDENEPVPPLDEEMDAALRDAYAFAPGAAEEAARRFRVPAPTAPRWPWVLVPVAAAAGIAIGVVLPSKSDAVRPVPPPAGAPVVAFVTQATKPLTSGGRGRFAAGANLLAGAALEVPADGRATLVLSDGTEVRLDRGCRVTLPEGRRLEVASGRLWARVAPGDPFLLAAGETKVTVLGTELGVDRGADATEVRLFSGKARVEAAGTARDLAAGQEVAFADGRLSEPRRMWDEAVATGWMLELVAHSGSHDRELADHMDRLLVELGHRKAVSTEENALVKDLGQSCRVPLARYLVSEGARLDLEPRRKAARVLARIADESVAAELAAALRDADAEVRVSAATALQRVSGGQVCAEPESFRASCDDGATETALAWIKGGCRPAPK